MNEDFYARAATLGAVSSCIDGPCGTNGLAVLPDWSAWDSARIGGSRSGERALAAQGVGLFWTTHATIQHFDGASRWIARALRLFEGYRAKRTGSFAIETHPHGAFRFLRSIIGRSPTMAPKGSPLGRQQRLEMLGAFIKDLRASELPNHDAVDAACAALVGALQLLGRTRPFGTPRDGGEIWMPDGATPSAFNRIPTADFRGDHLRP